MNEKQFLRCFICLEISRESIEYLKDLQKQIKKKNLFQGRFTEPENLHLTLKFLGEIDENKVQKVKEALGKIKIKSFKASLGELGSFNSRILWLKLNGKEIWDLQEEIDEKLGNLFPKEERFMSHITIARMKEVPNQKLLTDYLKKIKIKKISFNISDFVFKKSELLPEGPVYRDIARYELIP